jgi:hypothetical protein
MRDKILPLPLSTFGENAPPPFENNGVKKICFVLNNEEKQQYYDVWSFKHEKVLLNVFGRTSQNSNPSVKWRNDTQHNVTQRNDTQHNDTQHKVTQHNDTQHNVTQRNDTQHNDTQHNDNQHNDNQHNDTQHNDTQHNDNQHNDNQQNGHSA